MDGLEEEDDDEAAAAICCETGRGGSGFVLEAQSFSSAAISEVELGSSEEGGAARGLLYALNALLYGFGCWSATAGLDVLWANLSESWTMRLFLPAAAPPPGTSAFPTRFMPCFSPSTFE